MSLSCGRWGAPGNILFGGLGFQLPPYLPMGSLSWVRNYAFGKKVPRGIDTIWLPYKSLPLQHPSYWNQGLWEFHKLVTMKGPGQLWKCLANAMRWFLHCVWVQRREWWTHFHFEAQITLLTVPAWLLGEVERGWKEAWYQLSLHRKPLLTPGLGLNARIPHFLTISGILSSSFWTQHGASNEFNYSNNTNVSSDTHMVGLLQGWELQSLLL